MSHDKFNAVIIAVILTMMVIVAWFYFYNRAQKSVDNLFRNSGVSPLPMQSSNTDPNENISTEVQPETNPASPLEGNVIRTVGEREGAFMIIKINIDSVEGYYYPMTSVTREPRGIYETLRIGDDIGYSCEGVSEKIVGIDQAGERVGFYKIVNTPPRGGCPK